MAYILKSVTHHILIQSKNYSKKDAKFYRSFLLLTQVTSGPNLFVVSELPLARLKRPINHTDCSLFTFNWSDPTVSGFPELECEKG